MSELLEKQLVEHQTALIFGLIRETRVLLSSLESIESIVEDAVVSFSPLLLLTKTAFQNLLETGLVDDTKKAMLQEDIEMIEEQIDEFESHNGVFAGLRHSL